MKAKYSKWMVALMVTAVCIGVTCGSVCAATDSSATINLELKDVEVSTGYTRRFLMAQVVIIRLIRMCRG